MAPSSDYFEHQLGSLDNSRLPDDLELTARDAEADTYTYTSKSTGLSYTSAPGNRYGPLHPGFAYPKDEDETVEEDEDANESTRFINALSSTAQENVHNSTPYQPSKHRSILESIPTTGSPKPANRYADLDTDDERLPADLARTGYDADTGIYYYTSRSTGLSYAGLPGNRHGEIYRENSPAWHAARARETQLVAEMDKKRWWWREEATIFFPFFLIAGAFVLLIITWPFGSSSSSSKNNGSQRYPHVQASCAIDAGEKEYHVIPGDTCWSIAQDIGLESWEELENAGFDNGVDPLGEPRIPLDCDHLMTYQALCYPDYDYVEESVAGSEN